MGTERKEIILPEQMNGAVVPVDVEGLVAIVDAFDKFKSMVLKESDFWIDKRENKKRVKKSGWLKYALACNVNLEKIDEREVDKQLPPESGNWVTVFHFDYRAIAPTGRYAEASGSASTDEREGSDKVIHDTRSLAQTRAMNRAISNLVGGGEISAEETMGRKTVKSTQKPAKKKASKKTEKKTPEKKTEKKAVQLSLGKVNVDTVALNLKAAGIPEDTVIALEQGDHVIVDPTRELTEEEIYKISGVLEDVGAVFEEKGYYEQQWKIEKKA